MELSHTLMNSKKVLDTKEVFDFFKKETVKLPNSSETPLGQFLEKSKEEKLEDYTKYELKTMLDAIIVEYVVVELENEIFDEFLLKHDPRYSPEDHDSVDDKIMIEKFQPIVLTSKEMMLRSNSDENSEADSKDTNNWNQYQCYIKAIEQEIKEMHNAYQKEVERHEKKLGIVLSELKGTELHLEKIVKTREMFETFIVQINKKKLCADPQQVAEFLKLTLKQDKEDIRRFKVMLYQLDTECKRLYKHLYVDLPVHRVDFELLEIERDCINNKIFKQRDEFFQLKKILDTYNRKLDRCKNEWEEKREELFELPKTLAKLKCDIVSHNKRLSVLKNELERIITDEESREGFEICDFLRIGQAIPDPYFYVAGKMSCARTKRKIAMYQQKNEFQKILINLYADQLDNRTSHS